MPTAKEILERAIRHHEAGELEEAGRIYRALLAQQPSHVDAIQLLGVIEHQVGNHQLAIDLITRAIELQPATAHFWCNLAEAQRAAKKLDAAETSLRQAIALSPRLAVPHNNLGLVLDDSNRTDEARAEYEAAIQIDPHYAQAYVNLAKQYGRLGDLDRAVAAAREALRIDPGQFDAYVIAGHALATGGGLSEGIELLQAAVAMKPDSSLTWHLANALRERGDHAACLEAQRRAMELDPKSPEPHGKLLFDLDYSPDVPADAIAAEHFAWGERYTDHLAQAVQVSVKSSHRRLRIGYVSGDFRRHAVGQFLRPLLREHDRSAVEIFCYASNQPDERTDAFKQLCDHWRDLRDVHDDEAAALVRADEIDILVDLSGHTNGNRLLLFARKPAPLQATYLGYPDTTGMSAIDFRITDAACDPPGMTERFHREKLARISAPFLAYEPLPDAPPVSSLPIESNGHVTFGSFNRPSKISRPAIETWAQVLRAVPGSRLVMKGFGLGEEKTRQIWRQRFARSGVEPHRIDLFDFTMHAADHLRAVGAVDIALDAFPYNGTATTCDSMWMGVPVVTLIGDAHVSRVGLSLISSVGIGELAAADREQYVQTAVALANDPHRLRALRGGLRDRMARSPLTDARRLARDIESLYQSWAREAAAHE